MGIDIGPETVKLVEINGAGHSSCQVITVAISTLPSGIVSKNEIKDLDALADVLSQLFKQQNIKTSQVAFAIPRSAAIIKTITVDNRLSFSELESRAWIEANQHFPDLIGEIYLDFAILDPTQEPHLNEMLLVACRKQQIEPYLALCKLAKLTPSVVEVNSYALERIFALLCHTLPEKTVALLNLDVALSTLIVLNDNKLVYAHDQSFDGQSILNKIKKFSTDPVQQTLSNEQYANLLKELLSAHFRHTLNFFYSSRPNLRIEKLMISGDCANIADLPLFIQQEAGIASMLADPFNHLTLETKVDKAIIKQHAPALTLCCGLALSPFEKLHKENQ